MRILLCAVSCAALCATARAQTTDWPLPSVMARAAAYISRYADQLSGMVVEESYVQDVQTVLAQAPGIRFSPPRGPGHRTLRSDLLLVRPQGADAWTQFRDVFEVDGRPVRDRNDRLTKLFLEPSKSTEAQADRIVRESARYNIGDFERNINLPFLAMTILDRRAQPGFQFTFADGADGPRLPSAAVFAPPLDATVIAFNETQVRSLIASPQGRNLPSHGRFWITLPSGQVLLSEMGVEDASMSATIHVAYGTRKGFDVPVPIAMHEQYINKRTGARVEGNAVYSNFRRFGVNTDEHIGTTPAQK